MAVVYGTREKTMEMLICKVVAWSVGHENKNDSGSTVIDIFEIYASLARWYNVEKKAT